MTRDRTAVELIAIGDELLSGATIDTNAAYIALELEAIGLRVTRKSTVADAEDAIADALRSALERTGTVITTGGLGPTRDDVTRSAVARVFGRPLEFRQELWEALQRRWARRGPIPETNRVQAEVPAGGTVFPNPRGTAPGIAVADAKLGLCILLPGPPDELRALVREAVVPYLAERADASVRRPFRRYLRTAGIAESAIAQRVGSALDDLPVDVAFLPEIDGNDLRLTAWGSDESEVAGALDRAVERLREILGAHIYVEGTAELAEVVGAMLRERGLKLAVAESCTAGLIAKRLTDPPGASDYFWGGFVVYDDRAKIELLGVDEATLQLHGAVSEPVVRQMAEGARSRSGAEAAVAVTGIAGPAGGSAEKPVGTVWLAVAVGDEVAARGVHIPGARDAVRARAAQGALDLLRRVLLRGEGSRGVEGMINDH
ncbi:MAG: competence/damage-inducible protein A [Gemmatimonadetes bacterium]|uniref:CinA-like protein n=1 Tax=Candidatus Kutchimonas denitrificans TaxID=3056748 RepID=A0AAE4ZCA4_9BACT|nr:competence/damage-inducible protein A [Gemmatimonadota bacterium]NIR74980.1 competence/damage-inducible protein A [Candidatus Kutchimonas denitrificans]NIS01563.1 competence/damage-inducible protein A [Gemmatimonadota bacterium]NIT67301.1 competence/damage-inducible protein A [Gemmatimonadota bacterium]NIU52664.1 competence/damage-inducible protein A [Gemmatimonadota bacterium]